MKKLILLAVFCGIFSLNVHADWDAAGEAREAAQRKAEQQKSAREKAKQEKTMRDAKVKALRAELGKDAIGKSDAEVERIYQSRLDNGQKQAAAFTASPMGKQMKNLEKATPAQQEAQMKAMMGNDPAAFAKEMERQYGGKK